MPEKINYLDSRTSEERKKDAKITSVTTTSQPTKKEKIKKCIVSSQYGKDNNKNLHFYCENCGKEMEYDEDRICGLTMPKTHQKIEEKIDKLTAEWWGKYGSAVRRQAFTDQILELLKSEREKAVKEATIYYVKQFKIDLATKRERLLEKLPTEKDLNNWQGDVACNCKWYKVEEFIQNLKEEIRKEC